MPTNERSLDITALKADAEQYEIGTFFSCERWEVLALIARVEELERDLTVLRAAARDVVEAWDVQEPHYVNRMHGAVASLRAILPAGDTTPEPDVPHHLPSPYPEWRRDLFYAEGSRVQHLGIDYECSRNIGFGGYSPAAQPGWFEIDPDAPQREG